MSIIFGLYHAGQIVEVYMAVKSKYTNQIFTVNHIFLLSTNSAFHTRPTLLNICPIYELFSILIFAFSNKWIGNSRITPILIFPKDVRSGNQPLDRSLFTCCHARKVKTYKLICRHTNWLCRTVPILRVIKTVCGVQWLNVRIMHA